MGLSFLINSHLYSHSHIASLLSLIFLNNRDNKIKKVACKKKSLDSYLTYRESVLQQVSEWNAEGDFSPRQIQDRIDRLVKVRREIVDKTGALQYWTTAYLKDPTLQKFLLSVTNAKPVLSTLNLP